MAKQQMPMMKVGGGLLGKVIGLVIVVAVLALVIKQPSEAATWARSAANMFGDAVNGVGNFLQQLMR